MEQVTVSIVSHGNGALLPGLLADLRGCPEVTKVIVTRNIPEPAEISLPGQPLILSNASPKGFGANQNAAFRHAETPYFAVLNPDIRLDGDPFPALLACMEREDIALCAPAVVSPAGALEDNARRFPTALSLTRKLLGLDDGRLRYRLGDAPLSAPWLAGMFMLARSADFEIVSGFDEGFFMYYEDVDLCGRLWQRGREVRLCPAVRVVHDARRASRHDPKHMAWHAASMVRYFRKHFRRLPLVETRQH